MLTMTLTGGKRQLGNDILLIIMYSLPPEEVRT